MAESTPIGRSFAVSAKRQLWGLIVMVAVIAADLWGACAPPISLSHHWLAAIGLGLMWVASGRDAASLGLRLTPLQPIRRWLIMTVWIGLAMLSFFAVVISIGLAWGVPMELPQVPREFVPQQLRFACVEAPLQEEVIYRLVLCAPLVSLIGPRWTIALSGVVFAGLHVLYDNPGIDNAVAGFVLGWAYLKSGSLAVPIVLHSLGNAFVLMVHVAAWWLL